MPKEYSFEGKIVTRIFVSVLLFFCTSCVATLNHKVIKESPAQTVSLFDPKNKFIRVKINIDRTTSDKREVAYLNRLRTSFNYLTIEELSCWKVFDTVHSAPSEVEDRLHPKKYDDDYSLTISLSEQILLNEPKSFLRILTFGGVPQKQTRELVFNVEILDRKSKLRVNFEKKMLVALEGSMIVVFYPFNSFQHPFMTSPESKLFVDLIAPEISKVFAITERK